jgi:hypothetical protein
MEQQSSFDSQESMEFGAVDPHSDQLVRNNANENSPPVIGILILSSL